MSKCDSRFEQLTTHAPCSWRIVLAECGASHPHVFASAGVMTERKQRQP